MAGKVRHLINRSGRYHARLVVPQDLRKIVGRTELRKPLGGDYRQALRMLPGAVAELQHQIAMAERKVTSATREATARYPLAPDQIAYSHYMQRLAFDDALRNDVRYASVAIDDLLVSQLRNAVAGRATDSELAELVGDQVERFRAMGNVDAEPGSDEWRVIARALCVAELEALSRVAERDEGDFSGEPTAPMIAQATPPEAPEKRVSLSRLWADYVESRVSSGFMRDGGRRQRPVIEDLREFLRHDDARRITKKDLMAWRDKLMTEKSAKTVNDIYLSAVRSLFSWAVENDHLPENVASNVRQRKPKKAYGRERGFTEAEAIKILKASRSYQPKVDEFGNVRETESMIAAKRWVPILCAFSGARVTKAPPAPKHLAPHAKAEWKRIMPQLIARRIITKADLAGVENYCVAAGAARTIADTLSAGGLPDLKLGGLQIRYMTTARQLAAEYGLTPTSRARIGSAEPDDDDDNPLAV